MARNRKRAKERRARRPQPVVSARGDREETPSPVSHATPDVELAEAQMAPDGLLVDYHLDDGNGIAAIAELRCRFGSDLPAILITADRSPHVRADARAQGIQLLHKPLKPAALRALLTQWRMQRLAAAE